MRRALVTASIVPFLLGLGACGSADDPPPVRIDTAQADDSSETVKILLLGDSMMENIRPAIEAGLAGGNTEVRYTGNPALARDVASTTLVSAELSRFEPDLVIMLIGNWEVRSPRFDPGSPDWPVAYRRDVLDPFVELATADRRRLLLIGMPSVRDVGTTLKLNVLNQQFEAVAEESPLVDYLDAGRYLDGDGGTWIEFLPSAAGPPERIRRIETAGLHLCPPGTVRLVVPLLAWVTAQADTTTAANWQTDEWSQPPALPRPEECPAPAP